MSQYNAKQLKEWRLHYLAQVEHANLLGLSSLARMYLRRVDAVDALVAGYRGGAETWVNEELIRCAVKQ